MDPSQTKPDSAPKSLRVSTGPERAAVEPVKVHKRRPISLTARGEPMVWLTGGSVAAAVIMIVGLLAFITYSGFTTFWPSPVEKVRFKTAEGKERIILGEPFRSESFHPNDAAPGVTIKRTLYRMGNVDVTGERFVWINDESILEKTC